MTLLVTNGNELLFKVHGGYASFFHSEKREPRAILGEYLAPGADIEFIQSRKEIHADGSTKYATLVQVKREDVRGQGLEWSKIHESATLTDNSDTFTKSGAAIVSWDRKTIQALRWGFLGPLYFVDEKVWPAFLH